MNSTMKPTAYVEALPADSAKEFCQQASMSMDKNSALTDAVWVRATPVLLAILLLWLVAANFLGWV